MASFLKDQIATNLSAPSNIIPISRAKKKIGPNAPCPLWKWQEIQKLMSLAQSKRCCCHRSVIEGSAPRRPYIASESDKHLLAMGVQKISENHPRIFARKPRRSTLRASIPRGLSVLFSNSKSVKTPFLRNKHLISSPGPQKFLWLPMTTIKTPLTLCFSIL